VAEKRASLRLANFGIPMSPISKELLDLDNLSAKMRLQAI
jgi:hypothetical protein